MNRNFRLNYAIVAFVLAAVFNLHFGCSAESHIKPRFYSYQQAVAWYQNQHNIEDIYPDSSAIYRAAYYESDHVLLLYFTSDHSKGYIFGDVPNNVWLEFKNASSKGRYYNTYIKGCYRFEL